MKDKHYHYWISYCSDHGGFGAVTIQGNEKISQKGVLKITKDIHEKYGVSNVVIFGISELECDCDE